MPEPFTWRPRRGVLVAVAAPAEPPGLDLAALIACPTCHAKVTEVCRTSGGRRTTPHQSRLAPRLCPCGALLAWKRRLCDACRDERNRESKRDHLRRLRARKETAA